MKRERMRAMGAHGEETAPADWGDLDPVSRPLLSGTLANGLTYVCGGRRGTHTVYAHLTVKAGIRHEPEGQNGIAHMVEHVVGRQTARYDDPGFRRATDRIGAQLNAGVRWEWTAYHITALAEHLEESLDLLREMVVCSEIVPGHVETQRRIVLEEIAQTADSPDMMLLERVAAALYPRHPLGRPICGTAESVRRLQADEVGAFYRRHYVPNNAVIAIVGDHDAGSLRDAAERAFGDWTAGAIEETRQHAALPVGATTVTERMLLNQAVVVVAVPVVGETHDDAPALELLAHLLGGGPSSLLWEDLRESRGWAYRLGCLYRGISDAGFLVAYCGVERRKVELATQAIQDILFGEIGDLDAERVRGAVACLLTRLALETQTNAGYGAHVARYATNGDLAAGRRWWSQLSAATPETLMAVRARHLRRDRCVVARVLPLRGLSGVIGGLRLLWRLRRR